MPELPDARRARFVDEYGLGQMDAAQLTASRELADYYEEVAKEAGDARLAATWVMGALAGALNRSGIEISESPLGASRLGGLLLRIADNTISGKIAKQVFESMWSGEESADQIIEQQGLKQITDSGAIAGIVDQVIADNAAQVENYRQAEPQKRAKMLGFFVGQVMKLSKGKANPAQVNELLRSKLEA
jgi:aspartyl-tRNA(Asn)/glutamyl-tRNA(Gln) amidotransferase subunit B